MSTFGLHTYEGMLFYTHTQEDMHMCMRELIFIQPQVNQNCRPEG